MALDAGAIIAHLKLDTKEFKITVREVKSGSKEMGDSAKTAGGAFSGLWKQVALGMGITNIVGKGIGFIKSQISDTIQAGRDFEKAWANTTTMMTTSAEETKKMKDELLKLSPTLGSATDLAKGLYQVLSASIPAGKAIEFLGEASKSAQAGVTDVYTSVDALTTVINAYGMSAEKVTDVSDIMFQTVKRGKLTYEEMAGALGTVVPIASQVGLGFDQVGAAMATLTRQGIDANTATVQLRQILVSVLNPSKEAEKTAKALGLEFNATALASKGLSGFLADVKEKTGGNAETMSQLFGNVRALTGVMGLAGEAAEGFASDLELMRNASGSTEEAFRKQMDSLDFWLTTAKNTFDKLKIAFYEGFSGPVKESIDSSAKLELQVRILQERFEEFGREIGETFKFVIDNAGIFWASLKGPSEWSRVLAERASGIKAMKDEMLVARIEAEDWASSLTNLNISQEELAKNYGKNTEEGAKWRAEMEALNRTLEIQKNGFAGLWGQVSTTAVKLRDQVNAILATSKTSEEAQSRIRALKEQTRGLADASKDGAGGVKELDEETKKYKETLDNLLESLGVSEKKERELYDVAKLLDGLYKEKKISVDKYNQAHRELVDKMFEYGETIRTTLPPGRDFNNLIDHAASSVNSATYEYEKLNHMLPATARWLKDTSEKWIRASGSIWQAVLSLRGINLPPIDWTKATEPAITATKDISNAFSGLYNDIATGFGDAFETFVTDTLKQMDFLHGVFFEHGINFKKLFQDVWDTIKTAFFRMIGEMASETVMNAFKGLFKSIASSATETMTSTAKSAVGAVTDITKGASSAISGLWTGLGAAVGSFLGTALAGLIGGGPSGHAQKQAINDTKDSRNFLADIKNFLYGTTKPWYSTTDNALGGYFEKFDGLKGSMDDTRTQVSKRQDETNNILKTIRDRLKNITGAQKGAFLTSPELVMTHGTTAIPEIISPLPQLLNFVSASARARKSDVNINVNVHLNGMIISDREFARSRMLPEILSALDAPEFKGRLQQKLGVA